MSFVGSVSGLTTFAWSRTSTDPPPTSRSKSDRKSDGVGLSFKRRARIGRVVRILRREMRCGGRIAGSSGGEGSGGTGNCVYQTALNLVKDQNRLHERVTESPLIAWASVPVRVGLLLWTLTASPKSCSFQQLVNLPITSSTRFCIPSPAPSAASPPIRFLLVIVSTSVESFI